MQGCLRHAREKIPRIFSMSLHVKSIPAHHARSRGPNNINGGPIAEISKNPAEIRQSTNQRPSAEIAELEECEIPVRHERRRGNRYLGLPSKMPVRSMGKSSWSVPHLFENLMLTDTPARTVGNGLSCGAGRKKGVPLRDRWEGFSHPTL